VGKWLKSPQTLLFEVRDKIAYVTFNRPEQRNAQNLLAMQEMNAAICGCKPRQLYRPLLGWTVARHHAASPPANW